MKLKLPTLQCKRCQYIWKPRTEDVRTCPHCKSPFWDTPRRNKPGAGRPRIKKGVEKEE